MAVWKYLPYGFYELDAVEAWLDEQASKGLSLQKIICGSFCRFEYSSAGVTRYRVNVPSKHDLQSEKERIDSYREMGWEYVSPLTREAEIYRALSPDAVELNTDEAVLDEALSGVLKNQIMGGIGLAAVNLFNLVRCWLSTCRIGLYNSFLQDGIWAPILLVIDVLTIFFAVFFILQPAIDVRKRTLLERRYHSHSVFAHRRRRLFILIAFAVAMILCLIMMGHDYKSYNIDPADIHPILTIQDFCTEVPKHIKEDDYCSESSTEKTVNYQQLGPTICLPDDEYMYAFRYDISTQTIRWQWLAANYAREYTKDWEVVEAPGYDKAWYHTYDSMLYPETNTNCQQLLLLKDNEIVEISYEVSDPIYSADLHNAIPMLER